MFSRRIASFLIRSKPPLVRPTRSFGLKLRSTAPWLSENNAAPSVPFVVDDSAVSRSRAPFSMPKNSFDDSVSKGPRGLLSWTQLGLLTELVESVYGQQKLESPTPVQTMVIPELLQEPPVNLAFLAATGSGKTLAYALPLLQTIKSQELFDKSFERRPKRPRVLILVPTRELAVQITAVVKLLCHTIKLSSVGVVGGEDYGIQRKALEKYVDVVVATPGRLVKHWKEGHVFLGELQHVVLDEMDTMLEQGFQQDLGTLLHPLLYKTDSPIPNQATVPGAPRIILTSATMTKAVQKLVSNNAKEDDSNVTARRHHVKTNDDITKDAKIILPTMRVLKAPGLHRTVPRLRQVFVDVGSIDKLTLLVDVVHNQGGRGAAVKKTDSDGRALTIVFCNTVQSARAAQHALAEAGLPSLAYHGDLNSAARSENLERFRTAGEGDSTAAHILVCTDLAARGLDIPEVDHVVMFDFPLNSLDYLHRSGRTARGVSGDRLGNGRVTALVAKRDKVLATAIEQAVQRGEPLDGLSSRKSDYLPGARLNEKIGSLSKVGSGRGGGRNGGGRMSGRGSSGQGYVTEGGARRDKVTATMQREKPIDTTRLKSNQRERMNRNGPSARTGGRGAGRGSEGVGERTNWNGPSSRGVEGSSGRGSGGVGERSKWNGPSSRGGEGSSGRGSGGANRDRTTATVQREGPSDRNSSRNSDPSARMSRSDPLERRVGRGGQSAAGGGRGGRSAAGRGGGRGSAGRGGGGRGSSGGSRGQSKERRS